MPVLVVDDLRSEDSGVGTDDLPHYGLFSDGSSRRWRQGTWCNTPACRAWLVGSCILTGVACASLAPRRCISQYPDEITIVENPDN